MRTLLLALAAATLLSAETHKFDPKANPAKDLKKAVAQASREHKRILLDVGGEWCSWCHRLDATLAASAELTGLLEKNFIVLKVNFSEENKNEAFLKAYPAVKGYPHFFVLDEAGKFLHSQDTGDLEEGKGYNLTRIAEFLKKWSPAS